MESRRRLPLVSCFAREAESTSTVRTGTKSAKKGTQPKVHRNTVRTWRRFLGSAAIFLGNSAIGRSCSFLSLWLKTRERQENGKPRAAGTNSFHCSPMRLRYAFHQSKT